MEAGKNVLIPTDYSACADAAVMFAAQCAREMHAHLVVLHVVAARPPVGDPSNLWGSGEEAAQRERTRLAQHVARLLPREGLDYDVEARWGTPPARIIEEVARERRIDLIVIGARGSSAGKDRVIGSVTAAVLRTALCPVVTVRPPQSAAVPESAVGRAAHERQPTVKDMVQQAPVTITQSQTLAEAEALMARYGVHQIPVLEGENLIGILAKSDLGAHVGYFDRTKVDAAMTRGPVTVASTDTAQQAARLLIEQNINALPVVQGDRLQGMVSRTDLLRLLVDLLSSLDGERH